MQTLLMEYGNRDLRAYFVWLPILGADNELAARQSTQRSLAPNSVYFWTPSSKLAQEAAMVLQMATGQVAWDVYLLYRKGILWEKVFPAPGYWQQQRGILQGDTFNPQVMRARVLTALR